ncbi:MAG: prepilin-type N-terminal cleavage/methylation domain-containing protein [Candidatus Nomurabacteria bacterium]|nr:MAG: prepilin-type N-terminal cleavage/methylation domain-containing protein [Candidatus Nomurabacteria bacterium]
MKLHLKQNNKAGFTLIESLVYIFIFVLISGGAIGLLFSLNDLLLQYKLKQELLASGTAAIERILIEARQADTLTLAGSVLASSTAGVIILTQDANSTKIMKNGTQLELYKNGVLESTLTTANVDVVGSTFYHYTLNNKELIRVRLDLEANIGNQTETWSVSGGAIIRGSYAST